MYRRKLYDGLASVDTLIAELQEREQHFTDEHVDSDQIFIDHETGNMVVREGSYNYHEHEIQLQALSQLANKLSIPSTYLNRCPGDLRALNINHWLKKMNKRILLRFDDSDVRAFLSDRYQILNNVDVITSVVQALPSDVQVRWEWTPARLVAQFVFPEDFMPADQDDFMAATLHIVNSEVAMSSIIARSALWREVCTNGLLSADPTASWQRKHLRKSDLLLPELVENLSRILTSLPETLRDFYRSKNVIVHEPEAVLDTIGKTYKLTFAQLESAKGYMKGTTKFDIINSLTSAGSNDQSLDLDLRERLQEVGGLVLTWTPERFENALAA